MRTSRSGHCCSDTKDESSRCQSRSEAGNIEGRVPDESACLGKRVVFLGKGNWWMSKVLSSFHLVGMIINLISGNGTIFIEGGA